MVVMGRWHLSISIAFLGSVFSLILPLLFTPSLERYPKALKIDKVEEINPQENRPNQENQ